MRNGRKQQPFNNLDIAKHAQDWQQTYKLHYPQSHLEIPHSSELSPLTVHFQLIIGVRQSLQTESGDELRPDINRMRNNTVQR